MNETMTIVQSAQRRTFPSFPFCVSAFISLVIFHSSTIPSSSVAKIGKRKNHGTRALIIVKTRMPFGENGQKSDSRLVKFSIDELDVAGSWNQIIGTRRNVSNSAIFSSSNRLIDDRVNHISKRAYGDSSTGVADIGRVRHGSLAAITRKAAENTLDGGTGRNTSPDYGLANTSGRKMTGG